MRKLLLCIALPMLIISCGDNKTKEPVKGSDSTQQKEVPVVVAVKEEVPVIEHGCGVLTVTSLLQDVVHPFASVVVTE